jgi:hypothetical protein
MNPAETIARFDGFLVDRGLSLDAVVLGGAALALLGSFRRGGAPALSWRSPGAP